MTLVGTTGMVRCEPQLGDITTVSLTNDRGGTSFLPPGRYHVQIARTWYDDEIGPRAEGRLLDDGDLRIATIAGTTGYPPTRLLRPEVVHFALDDFEPGGAKTPPVHRVEWLFVSAGGHGIRRSMGSRHGSLDQVRTWANRWVTDGVRAATRVSRRETTPPPRTGSGWVRVAEITETRVLETVGPEVIDLGPAGPDVLEAITGSPDGPRVAPISREGGRD